MRILGIDPGLANMGFGLITSQPGTMNYVTAGVVTTVAAAGLGARLVTIHEAMRSLLALHQPEVVAMERQIYCQNVQTAMTLGQVQGVVTLAAEEQDVEVWTATPRELKVAVGGGGQATKGQVAAMVLRLLNLREAMPDHATDALAAAIAYANRAGMAKRMAASNIPSGRRGR